MDHNLISLCIAELNIAIESEIPLTPSGNFTSFYTDGNRKSDSEALIAQACNEYSPKGKKIYSDLDLDVFTEKPDTVVRWFRRLNNHEYYAFCEDEASAGIPHVTVYKQGIVKNLNQAFHLIPWEKMLASNDRVILHASCIETQCGGILFTGESGIGKSTQSDLWIKYRGAHLINGDKTILYRKEEGWHGYGSPFAGSSRVYLNDNVPIRAIVLLEQSKTNEIRRISMSTAFRKLYANTIVYAWDQTYVEKVVDIITRLITEVPVYVLSCTPDENAVKTLETVL